MAWKTAVMNVDVDVEDEINIIRGVRARSNACYKCGEMGHLKRDCKYDGDKPSNNKPDQDSNSDTYDPGSRKVDDEFGSHHSYNG